MYFKSTPRFLPASGTSSGQRVRSNLCRRSSSTDCGMSIVIGSMCGIGRSALSRISKYTAREGNRIRVPESVKDQAAVFMQAILFSTVVQGNVRLSTCVEVGVKWKEGSEHFSAVSRRRNSGSGQAVGERSRDHRAGLLRRGPESPSRPPGWPFRYPCRVGLR